MKHLRVALFAAFSILSLCCGGGGAPAPAAPLDPVPHVVPIPSNTAPAKAPGVKRATDIACDVDHDCRAHQDCCGTVVMHRSDPRLNERCNNDVSCPTVERPELLSVSCEAHRCVGTYTF